MREWGVGQPEVGIPNLPIEPHIVVGVVESGSLKQQRY